ncbi:MAG: small subunit ribosomal protein S6 [Parcubacteria group bacterium Gr01-1014_44]|nr:MAG: small subunit ribosomal protein S6 [Parcubacteria group bacterium Gr01-1014_44]
MLEIEQKIENYELGFHLLPELEEGEIAEKTREIEGLIAKLGGAVTNSQQPKKQHLSYPIDHKKYSYFGVINFKLPCGEADQLRDTLKLDEKVLRTLVLKVKENQKILRVLKDQSSKPRIRTHTPAKPDSKPKEEIKPEVMEKQIEEVIGNI